MAAVAGGARHYRRWIDRFARGIGRRRSVVIVEPDALAAGCVERRRVRAAVLRLSRLRRAAAYVDAGHSLPRRSPSTPGPRRASVRSPSRPVVKGRAHP